MKTLKIIWGLITSHINLLITIFILIVFIIIGIPIIKENHIKNDLYKRYMNGTLFEKSYRTKDSLNTIIVSQKDIIKSNAIKLDSLYKSKSNKTIIYETNIQNFSNPNIVSDDSITKYISKKIHI